MAVSGIALAATGAGIVFVYAGFKGYSIPATLQLLVTGKSPAGQATANPVPIAQDIANAAAAASASVTLGSGAAGATGAAGTAATGSVPVPSGNGAGLSPAQYQAYAFSLFGHYGWGSDQQAPLVALWTRESGWDPTAYNPGTHTTNPDNSHAFGIPQALPADKMASAGSDWRTNGFTQIRWGLSYIAGRYGNPAGAEAHENANGWY